MICSVRADWPAPFNVPIGNPRADKRGRNGFECIGRRRRSSVKEYIFFGSVDREICVQSGQRLCIARSRITVCYSYNVGWRVEE